MTNISKGMVKFLYDVFVYNYTYGKTSLKYDKIKNLLREENQPSKLPPFYELLRMGLIDEVEGNRYSLTASKIFSNSISEFSLGVNLPTSFLEENNKHIHFQYLGLTIFKDLHCMDNPYNVEFNLNHYAHQFQPLQNIIKEWKTIEESYIRNYIKLQKFNPIKNYWKEVKLYDGDMALYKRFIHNDSYFEYVFFFGNKYYNIKSLETEKILFIRLILGKQSAFEFDQNNQILIVNNRVLLPNFIYKTLFITHILNIGKLPDYNQFHLSKKQVNQILKPLKLIYTVR